MMKPIRILVIFLSVAVLGLLGYGYYLYNKPHRSIQSETAISVQAEDLFKKYTENEDSANKIWLDKTLQVSGKIREITLNQEKIPVIVLETGDPMGGISCTLDKSQKDTANKLKVGDKVILKGLCTGMLSDVVLTKCILIQT